MILSCSLLQFSFFSCFLVQLVNHLDCFSFISNGFFFRWKYFDQLIVVHSHHNDSLHYSSSFDDHFLFLDETIIRMNRVYPKKGLHSEILVSTSKKMIFSLLYQILIQIHQALRITQIFLYYFSFYHSKK